MCPLLPMKKIYMTHQFTKSHIFSISLLLIVRVSFLYQAIYVSPHRFLAPSFLGGSVYPNKLQEVSLGLITANKCKGVSLPKNKNKVVCAMAPYKDTCQVRNVLRTVRKA